MPWVKLEDGFYNNPKFVGLELEDVGLWVTALAWSAQQLTDGEIPAVLPSRLGAKDFSRLIETGLWEKTDTGYRIHDYLDYQPSADEAKSRRDALRSKRAEAGRKGGFASGQTRRSKADTKQSRSKAEANTNPRSRRDHKYIAAFDDFASTDSSSDAAFAAWWEKYPKRNNRRVGKQATRKLWDKLSEQEREDATVALEHYRAACRDGLIARDPQRFLAGRWYADWIEAEPDPSKPVLVNGVWMQGGMIR